MRREIDIEKISDGKRYGIHDMVKADCQDCKGCSACCKGMGESIVLDPLDIWNLKRGTGMSFQELMNTYIELNVVDHIILPNLKMNNDSGQCSFLDDNGRCSIHPYRPGICRIFPLGRIYEDESFQYFLQINECTKTNRTKIKVSKWIDCSQVKENQLFISSWHYFLKKVEHLIVESDEEDAMKNVSMYLLNQFYVKDMIDAEGFYQEMLERIAYVEEGLGL
ncbi:MAG: YkgJ family cysteine cluster protein [Eubacteriales bacterium]